MMVSSLEGNEAEVSALTHALAKIEYIASREMDEEVILKSFDQKEAIEGVGLRQELKRLFGTLALSTAEADALAEKYTTGESILALFFGGSDKVDEKRKQVYSERLGRKLREAATTFNDKTIPQQDETMHLNTFLSTLKKCLAVVLDADEILACQVLFCENESMLSWPKFLTFFFGLVHGEENKTKPYLSSGGHKRLRRASKKTPTTPEELIDLKLTDFEELKASLSESNGLLDLSVDPLQSADAHNFSMSNLPASALDTLDALKVSAPPLTPSESPFFVRAMLSAFLYIGPHIQALCLSHNPGITAFPHGCCDLLPNLKSLTLSGLALRELPEAITALSSLQLLIADKNLLSILPKTIASLTHLKTLDLASNAFFEPPPTSILPSSLQSLSLANNALATLPPTFLQNQPNLFMLDLSGNDFLVSSSSSLASTTNSAAAHDREEKDQGNTALPMELIQRLYRRKVCVKLDNPSSILASQLDTQYAEKEATLPTTAEEEALNNSDDDEYIPTLSQFLQATSCVSAPN